MKNNDFKKLFSDVAQKNGFEYAFKGWFKESEECILVLDLQKSNYSNIYYLNIKINIQGLFGIRYLKSKDLVKKDTGDVFRTEPKEYSKVFNLDDPMDYDQRKKILEIFFDEFLNPYSILALTRKGIKELESRNLAFLLPAVKAQLELLH